MQEILKKTLSIVIPVFNEEKNISALYKSLLLEISKLEIFNYEIVFVNDGSTDHSLEEIKIISQNDSKVKYIDFSRNFGQQVALSAGIDYAKGDYIILMDADFQDPPELIPELVSLAEEGNDVVYAKRKSRKGESFLKKLTAKIFYRFLNLITNCKIPLDTGDFRIISRKVADILKQMPEQQKFLRGQIAWIGFKQKMIEYDRPVRTKGRSNYSYGKMMKFAIDGITSFSDFPLKFATFLGFFVSIIAFILMLWALYQRLIVKEYVQGWTSLILSVLFIGGIQLISIGIIGEYISRIAGNIRKRPLYIVNETNCEENKDEDKK